MNKGPIRIFTCAHCGNPAVLLAFKRPMYCSRRCLFGAHTLRRKLGTTSGQLKRRRAA